MSATEQFENIVDRLATAVIERVRSPIPIEHDLWDIDRIAEYLKFKPYHVRTRIVCLPDFPQHTRVPTGKESWSHKRWRAKEVIAWYEKYESRQRKS